MNNSKLWYKIVMQIERSTPPSLDLACPQAKTELSKPDHRFMEWSVDKIKYGQEASYLLMHRSL